MTVRTERHSGLGRGLASLIPQRAAAATGPIEIPLDRIRAEPAPAAAADATTTRSRRLAESIREHGVLQPILVTETLDGYQLVAGERRVRAAAHWPASSASRRSSASSPIGDQLELALVENLQREDLDPIEEAHAFRQLIDEFGFTQDEHRPRVGRAQVDRSRTRSACSISTRRSRAPSSTAADARATRGRSAGCRPSSRRGSSSIVVDAGLSVRQTEELVRRLREPREPRRRAAARARAGPGPRARRGGPAPVARARR